MAFERQWTAVPPIALTANGSTTGVIQVSDTAGFFVKMNAQLQNSSGQSLTVEIKRVINQYILLVGPPKTPITTYIDCSAFTTVLSSTISAAQQNKTALSMEDRLLATYEQEPLNDWRVRQVDQYGNGYTDSNPFPVAFDGTVSIGDVHVFGPAPANNELNVNPDGSINVVVESGGTPLGITNTVNTVTSVATGSTVTLVTFTATSSNPTYLQKVGFSGTNIAQYTINVNSNLMAIRRTYFGGGLDGEESFQGGPGSSGYILNMGDIVTVTVYQDRPYTGDFFGRIQTLVS